MTKVCVTTSEEHLFVVEGGDHSLNVRYDLEEYEDDKLIEISFLTDVQPPEFIRS